MELTILGMNGPFPAAGGACSGYLVTEGDTAVQMDLGCGTLAALTARIAPEALTALILTHWHYDHCGDVLPLIYRLQAVGGHLSVYAPVDASSDVRQALMDSGVCDLHDVRPGDTAVLGGLTVRFGVARHPVPAVSVRLAGGGHELCYTGDTNTVDGLTDFARGVELLLADGLFPQAMWAEGKPHLSAAMTAELARDCGAGRLIVTHLNPQIDPDGLLREARAIRPDAVLARMGDRYTVG